MRDILFRGKRIDNGEWVEGGYYKEDYTAKIYITFWNSFGLGFMDATQVDPSTVGQYTGLLDNNGEKIFEGDIVEGPDFDAEDGYGVVGWDDGSFEIENGMWCGTFHENYDGKELEVIGNIHDNPELLKGDSDNA